MFSQKIVFLFALGYISSARAKSLQDGSVITCEISPETTETGQSVTVTCHFPYDVDQLSSFWASVGYFPTSEHGRKYDVKLADCTKTNTSKKECFQFGDVYVIEAIEKKNLKLTITNISAQHSGRFLCQLMPQEGEGDIPESEMCSLTVDGVAPVPRTTVAAAVTSTGVEGVPATAPNSAGNDVKEETNSAHIIVPVVIVVVLAVVAAVIFVILYRRRAARKSASQTGSGDEPVGEGGNEGGRKAALVIRGGNVAGVSQTGSGDEPVGEGGNEGGRNAASVIRSGNVAWTRKQFQEETTSNEGRTGAEGGGGIASTNDGTNDRRANDGNAEGDDKHDDEAEEDAKEPLLPDKWTEGAGVMTDTADEMNNGKDDKGDDEEDEKRDDEAEEEDGKKPLLSDTRAEGGGATAREADKENAQEDDKENAQEDDKENAEEDDKDNDEAEGDGKNPLLPPITTEGVREMTGGDDETDKGKADDGTAQKDDKYADEGKEEELPGGIQEESGDEQGDKGDGDVDLTAASGGKTVKELRDRFLPRPNPTGYKESRMFPGRSPSKD